MVPKKRSIRPQKRRIAGVDLVTIPVKDYAQLLECQRDLKRRATRFLPLQRGRKSEIESNPDVASFFTENYGKEPMHRVLEKCREKFGAHLTPSRSAAYRFWQALQKSPSNHP